MGVTPPEPMLLLLPFMSSVPPVFRVMAVLGVQAVAVSHADEVAFQTRVPPCTLPVVSNAAAASRPGVQREESARRAGLVKMLEFGFEIVQRIEDCWSGFIVAGRLNLNLPRRGGGSPPKRSQYGMPPLRTDDAGVNIPRISRDTFVAPLRHAEVIV